MKSTLLSIPKLISSKSFEVIDGRLTLTPSKLTCLLDPKVPPSITLQRSVSSSLEITLKLIRPLSTVIFDPLFTL